jgi:glycine C-acetyltransferase
MSVRGFTLLPGDHAIVPVMIEEARVAAQMADALLSRGVYVIAFGHPVVPEGRSRIRVQLSASHTAADIDTCVEAFVAVRGEMSADGC